MGKARSPVTVLHLVGKNGAGMPQINVECTKGSCVFYKDDKPFDVFEWKDDRTFTIIGGDCTPEESGETK